MASYERYYNHLIKKAQQNAATYNTQRRRQADEDAQAIREQYREADKMSVEQSRLSVAQTEADYRKLYDANAVSEAVARRNAAEALANSQLTNSGLNATQQTAISLMRSRTDAETSLKKQAVLNRIMGELDTVRAQYREDMAEKTASVYEQAGEDMREYSEQQVNAAEEQAKAMNEADIKAAKQAAEMSLLEMEAALKAKQLNNGSAAASNKPTSDKTSGSTASDKTTSNGKTSSSKPSEKEETTAQTTTPNTQSVTYRVEENKPSKTAITINAATKKKQEGDFAASSYLRKCVSEGLITAEERADIMLQNGIREEQTYSYSYISGMVERMLKNGQKSDARIFIDTLINTGRVNPADIRSVILRVM